MIEEKIFEGLNLSYDDVLIYPQFSDVLPPEVRTGSMLIKGIELGIPILSSAMDKVTEWELASELARLGGLGVIHKNCEIDFQAKQVKKVKSLDSSSLVGAAIGVGEGELRRLEKLREFGVDLIVIDTAHGHSQGVGKMVRRVKSLDSKLPIIAGNVATKEACEFLGESGADGVKIGIGPGSICTTRIVAGVGMPQFQALMNCREYCLKNQLPFIADGGIKNSGDMAKALGTGASAVMLGSLLAATDKAPGEMIELKGKLYKRYRGMGSVGAMNKGSKDRYGQGKISESKKLVPEGVEGKVLYKGSLEDVIYQLVGGLRASMGYVGASDLLDFSHKVKFLRISSSSLKESYPHNID